MSFKRVRGGCLLGRMQDRRSAYRYVSLLETARYNVIGFRLVIKEKENEK